MNWKYIVKCYSRNIYQNPLSTSSTGNFLVFDIWIGLLPITIIWFTIHKALSISFAVFTTWFYGFN